MRFGDYELDQASRELRLNGHIIDVQPQVFDVLVYLVEHRDRMVTKSELLDEVWGTRFVTESALTSRIRSARQAIGDNGRDQNMIKTVHGHGYRFVVDVVDVDGPEATAVGGPEPSRSKDRVAPKASAGRRRRVERPLSSFVGRDADVTAVNALLGHHRVVSIVGPPGSGKTRLALEVAVGHNPVIVRLERTDDVTSAIAEELGVLAEGDAGDADLLSLCALALQGSDHLLVLDECDLIVDDVAHRLPGLLAEAADLRVLVTSRTALGTSDEVIHALSPLEVVAGRESPATILFVDRVHQIEPDRSFSDTDLAIVERICRSLDGLPLAIELAAGRLRHLTLAELEQRTAEHLDVLERPGADHRHGTLEAAFSWSWDVLPDDEKALLGCLAAVPDDLDLATAEVIGGPTSERLLMRLLDRSLLMTVPGPADTRRYRLLGVLRGFVLDRVSETQIEETRQRYLQHLAHWIPVVAAGVRRDDRADTVERAKSWRAATAGAVRATMTTDPARAGRLAGALSMLVEQTGVDPTSMAVLVAVAESDEIIEVTEPDDIVQIGHVCSSNNLDLMRRLGEWAEKQAEEQPDDRRWAVAAGNLIGWYWAVLGRTEEALATLEPAVELAREFDALWDVGSILQGKAIALGAGGQARAAIDAFGEAAAAYAAVGDGFHVNNVRYMSARVASEAGIDLDAAVQWAEQCADYATAVGNEHELAHALQVRARLPGCDDVEGTIRYAMTIFRRVGDLRCIIRSNLALAELRPEGQRTDSLAAALVACVTANDGSRRRKVGRLLIADLCAAERYTDAALVWGALDQEPEAPPVLADPRWNLTVIEGRGSGPVAVLDRLASNTA